MGEKIWYVVHTYAGSEERVKRNLEQRVKSLEAENKIFQVLVPTEPEVEFREGQRHIVNRKILPGYVLVEMQMDDQSWNVVRNTPGVTGFVSGEERDGKLVPVPLEEKQINDILRRMERTAPTVKVGFTRGESVRIISGPFLDFIGVVDEIHPEKGKVKVLVSFFGRETPVELDLLEVERL